MYADLHVHLRGTIFPAIAKKLAAENGISDIERLIDLPNYGWSDFQSFLQAYEAVSACVVSARNIEAIAYNYLTVAAADGALYVEFMLSPPHETRGGPPYGEQIKAIDAAADRAQAESGIECCVIATAVRHLGEQAAVNSARTAIQIDSRRLVGFGLTGDEQPDQLEMFREAFNIAKARGLKATAHAGEHLPADTIIEAVQHLGLDRIGHGISAAKSVDVMGELVALGVALEVCISSNIALGVVADIEEHPIRILSEAGCIITLGTDDPAFFSTTISREYLLANSLDSHNLHPRIITRNAINSAFCNQEMKLKLLSYLDDRGL